MIQIFTEDGICVGWIRPEFCPCRGDIININCVSYKVTSFQFFFTGDFCNAECPLDEHTPNIFVKAV